MLTIPYGKQQITQADIDAVVAVLKSTNLTELKEKIRELLEKNKKRTQKSRTGAVAGTNNEKK